MSDLREAMEREANLLTHGCGYGHGREGYDGFVAGAEWMAGEVIKMARGQADNCEQSARRLSPSRQAELLRERGVALNDFADSLEGALKS